jgi:hypothetical protein
MEEQGTEDTGTAVETWVRAVDTREDDNYTTNTTMARTGKDGARNPEDTREDLDGETSGDEEGDRQVRQGVGDRLRIRLLAS